MISSKVLEKVWFLYQTEGAPKGISINSFCLQRGVSYNEFEKWFRQTHRSVVPVEVTGIPEVETPTGGNTASMALPTRPTQASHPKGGILVTIKTHDGRLVAVNSSLVEQINVLKKHRYGSSSQRKSRSKDSEMKNAFDATSQNRDEDKDGFDGTNLGKQNDPNYASYIDRFPGTHASADFLVLKKSKKVYIWCLINETEKIVLFFYDKGSRSRASLKEFLGDAKLDALQSDGYNVYMYLDDVMIDADHLCCMAHARAKFMYALQQGHYKQVEKMLKLIERLYDIERQIKGKPCEKVLAVRREKSESIKNEILKELDYLKSQLKFPSDDLLTKAVNYMETFWKQLFLYLKDGRYTIDNLVAERAIRPLAVERNNSMFFCSHMGAEISVLYHTIIATCKKRGYKVLDYLKEFFKQIILGRCDYENLMPATIGIKANNKR